MSGSFDEGELSPLARQPAHSERTSPLFSKERSLMQADQNLARYNDPQVVAAYAKGTDLQLCEAEIFRRWLKRGCALLDLGAGGGRTAGPLSRIAGRYVGSDISPAMVEACKRRYPALEFRVVDATDLGEFSDGEFDAVVFSFNGIDYIGSDEGRARCFDEVARVLNEDGVLIFSSHNAKALFVLPDPRGAHGLRWLWRIIYAVGASLRLSFLQLRSRSFWEGRGYIVDPTDGGLNTYVSMPDVIAPQIEAAGMKVVDVVGGRFPDTENLYLTPWHYYACQKAGARPGSKA
jgi:SAM-dependent methyltransferase